MSPTKVYVTGATGFIGSHVVKAALEIGYHVRLSVRKQSQIQDLKDLFPSDHAKLEFEEIPDITKPDAFHNSFDGVEYIFHLASPMPGKGDDFQADYVDPAVKGTNAILNAAKQSPSVKRVVITSSLLALVPLGQLNATDLRVTEDSSHHLIVPSDTTFPEGFAGHGLKYHASKILAHQATQSLVDRKKPSFSIITLHPSFVLGPSLIQKSASDISGINAFLWNSLTAEAPQFPSIIVDVRDVADAHLRAAVVPLKQQGVTEFLISAPTSEWETIASFMAREFADVKVAWKRPFPEAFKVDVSRASDVLGMRWRPVVETVRAVVDQQTGFASR